MLPELVSSQGFWETGEKAYFIFGEQGEIAIILREPGSKLLILGSWGALSKMYMHWLPQDPTIKIIFNN